MSAELPWRYRIVPACWEWARFDAGWTAGGIRGLRAVIGWHGGCCAICAAKVDAGLDVDSDHASGLVRGLLCGACARAQARSDAKVFRSYRRLFPAMLLGVSVSAAVLRTGFWRRRKAQLLLADPTPPRAMPLRTSVRTGARAEVPVDPTEPRLGRRQRRMVVEVGRPERFRTSLRRVAPGPEATDRMRLALWQAYEDLEAYAESLDGPEPSGGPRPDAFDEH